MLVLTNPGVGKGKIKFLLQGSPKIFITFPLIHVDFYKSKYSFTCNKYLYILIHFQHQHNHAPDFFNTYFEEQFTVVPLLKDTLAKGHPSNKDRII